MKRFILTLSGIGVAVAFAAGPALAFQCPKLVGQINAAAGNRFDATAYDGWVNNPDRAAHADELASLVDGDFDAAVRGEVYDVALRATSRVEEP